MIDIKDFTPTAEAISAHGLGFIQVKLEANMRLHVWHPELPRRKCFRYSAVHNHRFSFSSTVLIGQQVNRRYRVVEGDFGAYDLISHDGPRSDKGGRESFICGRVDLIGQHDEFYQPGDTYHMAELEYHETPNAGVVVTLMKKLSEGAVHANSTILRGRTFDQDFNRFQLPAAELWGLVVRALSKDCA